MQDDIIVWGASKEEHDQRLRSCLTRIRQSGLKLNRNKCIFTANSLAFLGHIISVDGVKPDPTKVNAITDMPIPSSKADLQRFLGMINYVAKFVPNLSQITAPLRLLLKDDIQFIMQKPQLDAISELKHLITTSPCLRFLIRTYQHVLNPMIAQKVLEHFSNKIMDLSMKKSGIE